MTILKSAAPLVAACLAITLGACEAPSPGAETTPAAAGEADNGSAPTVEDRFPDYVPKSTPDTLMDYRPAVAIEASQLDVGTMPLVESFLQWRADALDHPGAMEEGAIQLGADERQYVPSDAELMAAELGARLAARLASAPEDEVQAVVGLLGNATDYPVFTYRHVDVMGSGRFFYASAPDMRTLQTGAKH